MRKQYYFCESDRGLLAWDVDRLVKLAASLPAQQILLSSIRELDEPFWPDSQPTCRDFVEHAQLMEETDLRYPIILSFEGRVMDGMHRVCKALLEGRVAIDAVRFEQELEPDHVGRHPNELPY